ncbi:hypothetical protein SDRG_06809 [Saprolegnia diclina VS20]|uniref:Uncharacterized protein n=1 Tax=Saprolegnia diclina (strain VS20) TaxID=1156394 RepID=T0RUG0_SAPDV|nr:hypothetical protein SDRG_06809 [Saprolegnia diclina VS20]EQC36073.1 hypothetical protein SDRG_06809 [Saprolegnia diclina VS20]|eukprot:XP_008610835.1 hypothetical protein SDRG_06809 [Saprolegnia diclina VS20]
MPEGYCLGLAEVIQFSPKKQLEGFVERLVVALEDALYDALPEVRHAARDAFDVIHKTMGYRSIDELIPRLLKRITWVNDLAQECSRPSFTPHRILGAQCAIVTLREALLLSNSIQSHVATTLETPTITNVENDKQELEALRQRLLRKSMLAVTPAPIEYKEAIAGDGQPRADVVLRSSAPVRPCRSIVGDLGLLSTLQFPDTIASTLMAKCDAFGAPVMCRHNDMEADRGMLAHLGACMEHAPRQRSSRATTS